MSGRKSRFVVPSLAAIAIGFVTFAGIGQTPARADDSQQLQLMEDQIRQLQAQIDAMKKAQQAQADMAAKAPAVLGSNQPAISYQTGSHQFGWVSQDGQNSIELTGRLMFDFGDYLSQSPETTAGAAASTGVGSNKNHLVSGIDARRDRLGVTGRFGGDWAYTAIADFGGSADQYAIPGLTGGGSEKFGGSGGATSAIENAFITYNGFNNQANAVPTAFDVGYINSWVFLDNVNSSNDLMFMEPATPQTIASAFGGGDNRSAIGARAYKPDWFAAGYLTGPTTGALHTNANITNSGVQTALTARATYQVVQQDSTSVHVGANAIYMLGIPHGLSQNGSGAIAGGLTLSDRPELRIDPTAILNTGAIPAQTGWVVGGEAAGGFQGFFAQGEIYDMSVAQLASNGAGGAGSLATINPSSALSNQASPTLNFMGGYAEASYSIGGYRHYNASCGCYTGVIPDHPLSMSGSGWGAIEFGARYSYVNLNSHFTYGTTADLTGGVNGGVQTGIDFGINYYPYQNVKFMLDYINTDITDFYAANALTPKGVNIDAVAARAEVFF